MLVGWHEQAQSPDLPHDELALLSSHWGAIGSSPRARAALTQRGSRQIWFDPETVWLAGPAESGAVRPRSPSEEGQRTVRGTACPTNAIEACLTLKALFGLPLRQIEAWNATGPRGHGEGGPWKAVEACRTRLVSAGLQHPVALSEGPERRHPVAVQHGCSALAAALSSLQAAIAGQRTAPGSKPPLGRIS